MLLTGFALLEFACLQAHEFTHHLTGRAVCGAWGWMTFGRFASAPCDAAWSFVPIAAGPALTYSLILLGGLLVRQRRAAPVGLALIFANLPLARLVTTVTARGDEILVARHFVDDSIGHPAIVVLCLLLLALPLRAAWPALPQQRRGWWFAALLLLPLLFDAISKRLLLEPLLQRLEPVPSLAGVPVPVLLVDLAAAIALALWIAVQRRPAPGAP